MRARRIPAIVGAAVLAAVPAVVLVGGAGPAGAVAVGDEASFRTAWDTATEITLTANITLTCANGGDADRSSNDPVVLDGAGHTIAMEAGCNDRVLDQNGDGNTTLRNVTVTGGNTSDDGGGYEHDGAGSLTIESSTFANNTGCSEGGGVESEQDVPVIVRNSTFVGNRSDDEAGIDLDEGGDLLVVNSTFTGNVANDDGAISVEGGSSETITLVYATVVGNIETTDECSVQDVSVAEAGEAEAGEAEAATPPVTRSRPRTPASRPTFPSTTPTRSARSVRWSHARREPARRPPTARSARTRRSRAATTSPTTPPAGSPTSRPATARTRATRSSGRWRAMAGRPRRCCRRPAARC